MPNRDGVTNTKGSNDTEEDKEFNRNIDAMIDRMNQEIKQREDTMIQRKTIDNMPVA